MLRTLHCQPQVEAYGSRTDSVLCAPMVTQCRCFDGFKIHNWAFFSFVYLISMSATTGHGEDNYGAYISLPLWI